MVYVAVKEVLVDLKLNNLVRSECSSLYTVQALAAVF